MKHESRSLAMLRNANPVSVEPAAARSSHARAVFEQIVSEPRTPQADPGGLGGLSHLASVKRFRAQLVIGGAGITALIVAIVVLVVSGSTAPPAFAGWSARPTVASAAQSTTAARSCGLAHPVLTEARGPYIGVVFASRSGGSACIEGPSVGFVGSIGGAQAPNNRLRPGQIGTAVVTGSDSDGQSFIVLAGRVGSAVRSVVIHRSNHVNVIASIHHGWFLAWWPGNARATNATVTTSSGEHTVGLPATGQMSCHAGPGLSASCGSSGTGSNGPGSAGLPGPPLIGAQITQAYGRTVLFSTWGASKVLVCFHQPSSLSEALRTGGPTGPCEHAKLLTRIPPRSPIQKNLLEIMPKAVWTVKLPARSRHRGHFFVLVVAFAPKFAQIRNEMELSWK